MPSREPHAQRHPFVWFQAVVWGLLSVMALLPALSREQNDWPRQLLWVSAWISTGVLTTSFAASRLTRLPDGWLRGGRLGLAVLITGALGSLAWGTLLQLLELGVGRDPVLPPHVQGTQYLAMTFGRGLFLLWLWSALFLVTDLSRRMQDERERSVRAQAAADQAQLQLLRSQLNPHFLFNALNSVVALINENPRGAQTMVRDVSTLLRRALNDDGHRSSSLQQELEFVQLYVKCEQVRFEERLRVTFEIADDVLQLPVPTMLLHPLVENAVKHGMHQAAQRPLEVRVSARREGKTLRLEVSNDGTLAPASEGLPQGNGVGLRNVKERLATLFPGSHRFELSERDGRVVAVIELPLEGT